MASKRKDTPIFRMVVEPGALVPADAYTQERLDTYRHNTVVNVRMTQDVDPPLMRKYWSVLSLCVKQCRTPWHSADEASDALKRAFGVVRRQRSASGAEVEEIGSLTDLEGPAFEDFFEGAMALLYRITGVDPETLWKETPDPAMDAPATSASAPDSLAQADAGSNDSAPALSMQATAVLDMESFPAVAGEPASVQQTQSESSSASPHDDGVGGGDGNPTTVGPLADQPPTPSPPSTEHQDDVNLVLDVDTGKEEPPVMRHENIVGSIEADERAAVNSIDPMSTRELKQEAIKKVLDLVLDPDLNDFDRRENLEKARAWWIAKMPGHPNFVKTVFETAGKVMRKELPRPAAQNFLYGLRDG